MDHNNIINIVKRYIRSEESSISLGNASDIIEQARTKISPDQSNALDLEIQILEDLIEDLDRALAQ